MGRYLISHCVASRFDPIAFMCLVVHFLFFNFPSGPVFVCYVTWGQPRFGVQIPYAFEIIYPPKKKRCSFAYSVGSVHMWRGGVVLICNLGIWEIQHIPCLSERNCGLWKWRTSGYLSWSRYENRRFELLQHTCVMNHKLIESPLWHNILVRFSARITLTER